MCDYEKISINNSISHSHCFNAVKLKQMHILYTQIQMHYCYYYYHALKYLLRKALQSKQKITAVTEFMTRNKKTKRIFRSCQQSGFKAIDDANPFDGMKDMKNKCRLGKWHSSAQMCAHAHLTKTLRLADAWEKLVEIMQFPFFMAFHSHNKHSNGTLPTMMMATIDES